MWLGSLRVNLFRKVWLKELITTLGEVQKHILGQFLLICMSFGMVGLKAHPPEGLLSPGRTSGHLIALGHKRVLLVAFADPRACFDSLKGGGFLPPTPLRPWTPQILTEPFKQYPATILGPLNGPHGFF